MKKVLILVFLVLYLIQISSTERRRRFSLFRRRVFRRRLIRLIRRRPIIQRRPIRINVCSYKEVKLVPDNVSKKIISHRWCYRQSVNCDIPSFPFLQCQKSRCVTDFTLVPRIKRIYKRKDECCPGWSESNLQTAKRFLRDKNCTNHTSCITLPQFTPKPCFIERKTELKRNSYLYRLTTPSQNIPETISEEDVTKDNLLDLTAFPVLNLTSLQVAGLTLKNPDERTWAIAYNSMISKNSKIFNETLSPGNFKPMTNYSDYADLLEFYRERQHTGGPFDKYFRYPSQEEEFKDIIKSERWQEDKVFVEQRLSGLNPMMLRKLGLTEYLSKRANFSPDLDDAVKEITGEDVTLLEMVKRGIIFIVDYPLIRNLSNVADITDHNSTDRFEMSESRSPLAFFISLKHSFKTQYELKPLAIQIAFNANASVITPSDGGKWLLAKQEVQLADLTHVEIIEHLLKTHYMMEPICVTLKRTLSSHHPLYEILKWHCRGTFLTNSLGLPSLVAPQGLMHQLFAIGHVGAIELLNKGYSEFSWQYTDFEGNLKDRGVFDEEKLPFFPYRDDGLIIWRLVKSFANEYVNLYYKNHDFVTGDTEIQNFANELSASGTGPNGGMGMVEGFPSKITTKGQLKDILARIIFTPLQHHAVNYPVSYYGGFVPNMPTKLYNDPQAPSNDFSVYNLPQTHVASLSVSLFFKLGSIRFDNLLDYASELSDKEAGNIVQKYYNFLMGPTLKVLLERNNKRLEDGHATYPYFLPGWMPNSIHT